MKNLKIGLSLSGGGTKTAIYIGVLKALIDQGIDIKVIGGLSGGSIISSLFSTGYSIDEIIDLYKDFKFSSMIDTNPFDGISIIDHKKMERLLKGIFGRKRVQDCYPQNIIFATNLSTRKHEIFKDGLLAQAIIASCSIPPAILPYKYKGHTYVDGGFSIQYGAKYFREAGANYVIGADVNGFTNTNFPGVIDVFYQAISCTLHELSMYESSVDPIDMEITNFHDHSGMFEMKSNVEGLVKVGERATLKEIKRLQA